MSDDGVDNRPARRPAAQVRRECLCSISDFADLGQVRRGHDPVGLGQRRHDRAADTATRTGDKGNRRTHWITTPPLGEITWPVSHVHSATSRIARATSSGVPNRCSAMLRR